MKAFNQLVHEINEGSTHSALTADLAELLRTVQSTGRSGALTLKLTVAPAQRTPAYVDKITITADIKLALPKPNQPADFFYLTEEGETSRNHPKQQDLQLREVPLKPISTTDADGVITFKDATK